MDDQVLCRRRKKNPAARQRAWRWQGVAEVWRFAFIRATCPGAQGLKIILSSAHRRHAVSRRLRKERVKQVLDRLSKERERHPVHRRDSLAGGRRRRVRRRDGRRQSLKPAQQALVAVHRSTTFSDVESSIATALSRRFQKIDVGRPERWTFSRPPPALRAPSRRRLHRRSARGGGVAVGATCRTCTCPIRRLT